MVKLDIFSNIIKQLAKVRDHLSESSVMFRRLSIIILIEDFYQFPSIIGWPLYNQVYIKKDLYSKIL